jgi:LCP family protein required for cell wall assembly
VDLHKNDDEEELPPGFDTDERYQELSNFFDTPLNISEEKPEKTNKSKKKKKKRQTDSKETKKLALTVASFFVSLLSVVCGSILIYVCFFLDTVNYDNKSIDFKKDRDVAKEENDGSSESIHIDADSVYPIRDPMVLNVIIFGVDRKDENENGRSDSMICVSIDERHKKLKICSILRDIWVKIPGRSSFDKLNHAFSYGGRSLAVMTLEKALGVVFDRDIALDFPAFVKAVASFGGLPIVLSEEECIYINRFSGESNYLKVSNGEKNLSGKQALCHARNRDLPKKDDKGEERGDDFARIIRQQEIMTILLKTLKGLDVRKVAALLSNIGPSLTTNFRKTEILRLLCNFEKYVNYPLERYFVPETNDYKDGFRRGMSVLILNDIYVTRRKFLKFIFEDSIKEKSGVQSSPG